MKWLPSKRTWLQLLFWGLLWIAIPFLLSGRGENYERYLYHSMVVFGGILIVISINVGVLLPRLYFTNRQVLYFFAGAALVAFVAFLDEWDATPWEAYFDRTAPPHKHKKFTNQSYKAIRTISTFMPYLTALIASSLIEIASFANRKAKEAAEFRNEKLESELKFLKSQFNPHFLFNALNNIYSMSVLKSDKAPDNLLKLSGMLRYMLYDCKADKVTLGKEIEYLKHFIDLHLLKDSRGLNVQIDLDESRPNLPIAPMLFVPFVENAFKHSRIEDLENGWIRINLNVADNHLIFNVDNSVPKEQFTKDKAGGIGLENVKRQLELIYPNRHTLRIEKKEDCFSAHLKIMVHESP